ncbi:MAG TPA: non-homologous end-joining DNA ligase [Opitutales bacterium]|nr:non-homologous end-joining DNA ligase [Opitutales bacterium]
MHEHLAALPESLREKLKRKTQPDFISPMKATLVHEHFSDPGWIYERKLDGERSLLHKKGRKVTLYSRNEKKKNETYPEIAEAVGRLEGNFILDAEIVAFDRKRTSFKRLQRRMHVKHPDETLLKEVPVYVYAFDLLFYGGYDLTALPQEERKKLLRSLFDAEDPFRLLPHRREKGEAYLKEACEKGWEGLIAKDAGAAYVHKRSKKWLKFKCGNRQEMVIAGYTDPEGGRLGFGALLLGFYRDDKLIYAGRVGTGFDDDFLKSFHAELKKLERKTSPFADYDPEDSSIHWVRPEYVGEIGFTEWTRENRLRHPRFLGLREDKEASSVVKEGA